MWDDEEVRCVHYILADKPWMERVPVDATGILDEVNRWWWDDFEGLGRQMRKMDPEGWKSVERTVAPETF